MTWRHNLFLVLISLPVVLAAAGIQCVPGFMDAEYYYLGGVQLASGEGFSEPILWNYLDNPAGLPHPSHTYWMPLASIVAAFGMWLTRIFAFSTARIGYLLLSVTVPLATAALSYQFARDRRQSALAGLLAIFSGFYFPYTVTTDTFALNMALGAALFLVLFMAKTPAAYTALFIGILSGLFHLSRADGIVWLPACIVLIFQMKSNSSGLGALARDILLLLCGYFLVMAPWMARNYSVFGSLLSPGGLRMLWLTDYDQLYAFPADRISFQHWWDSGIGEIIRVRLWAAGINLQRAVAEQGMIFLTPLIVLGLWHYRKDLRVRMSIWVWFFLFCFMSFVFPFAGARGGYFHASASLQPLFWALTTVGLGKFVDWGVIRRGWNREPAMMVFGVAALGFAMSITAVVYVQRVIGFGDPGILWERTAEHYQELERELRALGATQGDVVMVKNPPGFFVVSNRPAIAIPDGGVDSLLAAGSKYDARYILLESDHARGLEALYQDPFQTQAGFRYLKTSDQTHIFEIDRKQ